MMTIEIAILTMVRRAGSGTDEADAAVNKLLSESMSALPALFRLIGRGWLLFGDGEPAALTLRGARALAKLDA